MRLLDRYEEELLEAARRLQDEPAGRARARRALAGARGGLAWVAAALAVTLALVVPLVVVTGGQEREQAPATRLLGWYASAADSGRPLPKGAPRGSTLRLDAKGRYHLTTGVHRVSGAYRIRDGMLELVSAGRYRFLPMFRTNTARPPGAPVCRTAVGVYRVIERRDSVSFELGRDRCRPRARVLSGAAWHRAGR